MPLRGRVGRHTQQGSRHCQNWQDDQQAVIVLLNRIPAEDGGAGGGLNGNIGGRIVAGMASDALYRTISTFENKHFPRQRSGFVDPGGAMLRRMEELAARSAKTPANRPPPDPIIVAPQSPHVSSLDRLRFNIGTPHSRPSTINQPRTSMESDNALNVTAVHPRPVDLAASSCRG